MFTEQGIWKKPKLIIFLYFTAACLQNLDMQPESSKCVNWAKSLAKTIFYIWGQYLSYSNPSQSPDCLLKDKLSRNAGRINTDHLHTWKRYRNPAYLWICFFSLPKIIFLVASMWHGSFKLLSHIQDSKLLVVVSWRSILLLKKLISKWTKLSNSLWTYKNYCDQAPLQEYHRT